MTGTLHIAEVARRSGFSPPTLRYYETIGLLPLAQRSTNGYRLYDAGALDRLGFIARAKQLGCSLDEITELTTAWDGGRCAPVQQRLAAVVAAKIDDAQARIVKLTALVADLRRSAAVLAAHTPDGACDDRCGCTRAPTGDPRADEPLDEAGPPEPSGSPASVALISKPMVPHNADGGGADTAPIACTLGAGDIDRRLEEWRQLLAHVVDRTPLGDGMRLSFEPTVPIEALVSLAVAEQECCRFFSFAITVDQRGPALEVRAPEDGQAVVAALVGTAP